MEEKGQYVTLLPPSQAALELRKHSTYKKLNAHQVRILYLLHEQPKRWDELKRQVDYFEMGNLIMWGLVLGTRANGDVLQLTDEAVDLLVQFCGLRIQVADVTEVVDGSGELNPGPLGPHPDADNKVDDQLIIHNRDGSNTFVNNPFGPMQTTYAALRTDPNAIPDLSPESRAAILAKIAEVASTPKRKRHTGQK